jgi:hypothetical protein
MLRVFDGGVTIITKRRIYVTSKTLIHAELLPTIPPWKTTNAPLPKPLAGKPSALS